MGYLANPNVLFALLLSCVAGSPLRKRSTVATVGKRVIVRAGIQFHRPFGEEPSLLGAPEPFVAPFVTVKDLLRR
jgi:hypothetical protein